MEKTKFKRGDLVALKAVSISQETYALSQEGIESLRKYKPELSGKVIMRPEGIFIIATFVGAIENTGKCVVEYDDIIRVMKLTDLTLVL